MKVQTPVFVIFENKLTPEKIERLKRKGCIPICIDGDNMVFRLEAKYEYVDIK